jgi:predicted nuclease of predicted toxin-antitoxin system
MDVAANVPKILSAMQRNQVSLKYQILIPESYFMIRHTEWSNYSKEQRDKEINSFVKKLNDMLSSPDNQFKSITTIFKDDPSFANALGTVEIKAIDDKIKANNWVPSSNTADAQIVQGLGLHPSQMGLAPEGGKMGAGSGSDQRESYNTQISLNTIDQQIILEPLNFISEYNGWGVTFFIDHTAHTTTNNQEDGLQPSDTTIISE